VSAAPESPRCDGTPGCITCGDVGVAMRVVQAGPGGDAVCAADAGAPEIVAVDLVGPVEPGDRLLVHAGVAIGRVGDAPA
jgi:hydrogenase maturation factor